jgi:hypothetical protein
MRGHFRYLRFKTFLMTLRTPQCEVFWALLSNPKHSEVPEDSKSPTLGVRVSSSHFAQSRVATFIVGSRFEGCFHNFYEHWVSHNIEGDVRLMKESWPLLVQIFFLIEFNPLGNETCQKVWMLLFVDLLRPSVLFVRGWKFEPLPFEMSKLIFSFH